MHEDPSAIGDDAIEPEEAAADRKKSRRVVSTTPANKEDEWTGLYMLP